MRYFFLFIFCFSNPIVAYADELNSADTAWILASGGLVLFMTLPGLALFYGGLVRTKNVLAVIMPCFAITSLISLIWAAFGYSLAFTDGGAVQPFIGGWSQFFLHAMNADRLIGSIPESVFSMYHLTIGIFAPALIIGSLAERARFFPLLLFCALWEIFVYVPICHWVWGDGWLAELGIIDFAGGLVVHGNAGIAALVGASFLGPRRGFPNSPLMPHNLTMSAVGAGILWVGWHGFSSGSALMASGAAGMAMLSTHISASSASVTWIILDWIRFGKPSVLGAMTGMLAGLGMIAAGGGYVTPASAMFIGIVASFACFYTIQFIKRKLQIDDALDVFPVHGVSGLFGALLTAIFADEMFGGTGLVNGIGHQLLIQMVGVVAVIIWSAFLSYLLFKLIDLVVGFRVTEEVEIGGLDIALHDEKGYNL